MPGNPAMMRNAVLRSSMIAEGDGAAAARDSIVNEVGEITIALDGNEKASSRPDGSSPSSRPRKLTAAARATSFSSNRGGHSRRFSRQVSVKRTGKLSESWPGSHHIRRLFRLFDQDGNGTISPAELRAGLATIGFDVANVAQLRMLQHELDTENTGQIRESQFIHAFRTLNRRAIEAKLRAGAGSSCNLEDVPVTIQLMKIGHAHDEDGVQSSFHHTPDVPISDLGDLLRAEEQAAAQDKAVRWLDVCGLHSGVLALLSNFYLLPHEMLGEEIEFEASAHADFFTGRSTDQDASPPSAPSASTNGDQWDPSFVGGPLDDAAAIAAPPPHPQRSASLGDPDTSPNPHHLHPAASATATSGSPRTSSSSSPHAHSTFKLLIHSLQMRNIPLHATENSGLKLVSYRHYKQQPPSIHSLPIHIIVANDHTLITVRPFIEHPSPTDPPLKDAFEDDELENPNDVLADFIDTLRDTDSSSMSSVLGLTSAKVLAMKLWEDVIDSNWQIRDCLKEFKVSLRPSQRAWTVDPESVLMISLLYLLVSDHYYRKMINDFERLASTSVRLFRPLLNTIAGLSGEHISLAHSAYQAHPPASSNRSLGTSRDKGFTLPARALYLKEVHSSLRLLHRQIARQFDQASLSVTLSKSLQEQYTQRGRDRSNDTLYLLTVVTTIVTPLQIATGVYGMNWENFPELHYENGYFWFWGINIALIICIGCLFKFREGVMWARESI